MSFNLIYFNELDSTNDFLKSNYQKYNHKTVIVAENQLKGRGRMNRTWYNAKGDSLLFSILLTTRINANQIGKISLMACASCFLALSKHLPNLVIKWPNDLIVNNKKIGGILVETSYQGNEQKYLIIGVGLNLNNHTFPSSLSEKATSLWLETNKAINKRDLLDDILVSFENFYQAFQQDQHQYLNLCRNNFLLINQEVTVIINQVEKKVIILDILDNGNLLIEDSGIKREVVSGEIILPY